jgi:hypothetical protein
LHPNLHDEIQSAFSQPLDVRKEMKKKNLSTLGAKTDQPKSDYHPPTALAHLADVGLEPD